MKKTNYVMKELEYEFRLGYFSDDLILSLESLKEEKKINNDLRRKIENAIITCEKFQDPINPEDLPTYNILHKSFGYDTMMIESEKTKQSNFVRLDHNSYKQIDEILSYLKEILKFKTFNKRTEEIIDTIQKFFLKISNYTIENTSRLIAIHL
ncbi:MAG: hypothetical protein ACTSVV_18535 [Promethearchaeota archaeon]